MTPAIDIALVRAWDLIAQLAALAQRAPHLHDIDLVVGQMRELLEAVLPGVEGRIQIHNGHQHDTIAWGIPATDVATSNGNIVYIDLNTYGQPAGYVSYDTSMLPDPYVQQGFQQTLRAQIELVLTRWLDYEHNSSSLPIDQSRLQQLKALQHISRELTATLYLSNILGFALEETRQATRASTGYIALQGYQASSDASALDKFEAQGVNADAQIYTAVQSIDGDEMMRIIASSGYLPNENTQLLNRPLNNHGLLAEQAAFGGQPILVDHLIYDDRPDGIGPEIASALAMPIYYESQVIGVINLHSTDANCFDREDMEFVRAVADQAALAIGNENRWIEQRKQRDLLQRRANTLHEVLRIGQEMRADRSLEDVLEQIAFSVMDTAGFRGSAFFVMHQETQSLQLVTGAGLPLTELDRLRYIQLPLNLVDTLLDPHYQVGRAFFLPASFMRELEVDLDLIDEESEGFTDTNWQAKDALFLPLYSTRGQLLGLLEADDPYDRQRPTLRSIEAIEILANQAAIAIENAQLLHEAHSQTEQMTAMYRVSTAMVSTLDLDESLEGFFNEIVSYLHVPSFTLVASYDALASTMKLELIRRELESLPEFTKKVLPLTGLTGWVLQTGQMIYVRDYEQEQKSVPVEPIMLGPLVRSWLGIPLRNQEEIIGVLSVQHFEPNAFSEQDVQFLMTLANQLAVTMGRARIFQERERRIEELNAINHIARITSSNLDIRQVLDEVYHCLSDLLPMDAFYASIYQPERDDISVSYSRDEGILSFSDHNGPPNPKSLSAWILQNVQCLRFDDLREEQTKHGFEPVPFGNKSKQSASWLGVPLLGRDGQAIGVLSVQSYTAGLYGDREERFLVTVASQFAMNVLNAALFQQAQAQVEQLALFNRVAEAGATSFDLEQLMNVAIDAVQQTSQADMSGLLIYDQIEERFVIAAIRGFPLEQMEEVLERTPIVMDFIPPIPLVRSDAATEPSLEQWHDFIVAHDIRTVWITPLLAREQALGLVLAGYSGRSFQPSERDIEQMSTIANQTAIALEKMQLFEKTQRSSEMLSHKVSELSALLESSRVLSSSLQPSAVLNMLMEVVRRYLHVDTVALWQDPGDQVLIPVAMLGMPEHVMRYLRVPIGKGLTGQVASKSQTLIITNVEQEGGSLYPEFNRQNNYTSFMGVPVRFRERTIGVLSVMTTNRRNFTHDDEQLLSGMADQAAIALENARLFDEREQRLQELVALKDISTSMNSTLDRLDLLERMHDGLDQVIDVNNSVYILYDSDSHQISYSLSYKNGQRLATLSPHMQRISAYLVQKQEPLLISSQEELKALGIASSADDEEAEQLCESLLFMPIHSGEQLLGLISIGRLEQNAYDSNDLRFISTVASQTASALTNATLFFERGRKIAELETFNQIGQSLSLAAPNENLLELIYKQTSSLLDTRSFHIALYDEQQHKIHIPLAIIDGQRREIREPVPLLTSLTGYVIRTQSSLMINENIDNVIASLNLIPVVDIGPGIHDPRSWLGVPMVTAEKAVGMIAIQNTEHEQAYTKDDLRLLETIAAWAATVFENSRLLGETRQSVRDLTALYDISLLLTNMMDAFDIQYSVAASILELLQVDVCMITPVNDQGEYLTPFFLDAENREIDKPFILESSKQFVPALLADRHPIILQAHNEFPDFSAQSGLSSIVAVITSNQESEDVIVWAATRQPREWQERDLSLLSILVNQLGQALARAQLFVSEQTRRRVADTLRETAQKLTTLRPLNDIVELIFDQLAHVLPYDTASLMLRDGNMVSIIGGRGFDDVAQQHITDISFNIEKDIHLREIVDTGLPLVMEDAQASPYYVHVEGTEHVHGWIGAPLLVDEEVIGLLCADSREIGSYDAEDGQIAFALASQAAQAIRNASLYDEVTSLNADLEQRVLNRTAELETEQQRLRAVHALTLELTESLDLQTTLNKALELTARAIGAEHGSLLFRDQETQELTCRAFIDSKGEVRTASIRIFFPNDAGMAAWIMHSHEAVCISDVRNDPRWVQESGRADSVRSLVAAPLMMPDGPLGVLMLASSNVAMFGDAQLQLLTTIANEVAIVIHNATLYTLISDLAMERGNTERQLREENSKSQAILQSLGEGVIVFDEQQQIVLYNSAAEQMLKLPSSLVVNKSLNNILSYAPNDEDAQRSEVIYDGLQRCLDELDMQVRYHSRMMEIPNPQQSILLNSASWLGPTEARYGSVVVLRDVTREIESDRAKREFISSVSHELRTPLTSIKGYVDLLLLTSKDEFNATQLQFLGVVKNNANRLMELINDILEIGRIDSEKITLNFEQVDIHEIFQDTLQTLRVLIDRKRMDVVMNIDEALPSVTADTRRLSQIILNLMSNALKYTYEEGKIHVRAFLNPAGMLQIEVEDNGVGISLEDQKNLFRRFQRFDSPLRDEAGGTGLGLSIAKSFVELHGGEMWVSSEVNKGSTFRFIIPVTQVLEIDEAVQD